MMKYLYSTLGTETVSGRKIIAEIKTDGELLYATVKLSDGSAFSGTVEYNDEADDFSVGPGQDATVAFDYLSTAKNAVVWIGSEYLECSWEGTYSDADPAVSVEYCGGVRVGSPFTATFDFSGAGSNKALIATRLYIKSQDGGWLLKDCTKTKSSGTSYSQTIVYTEQPGAVVKFMLIFASYKYSLDQADRYIGLCECESPEFTLTAANTPFAPTGLTCSCAGPAKSAAVSWNAVSDANYPVTGYKVFRSVSGGSPVLVAQTESTSYAGTVPAGAYSVRFSVCSVSDGSVSSCTVGETIPFLVSNVYVGVNGTPVPASGIFVGINSTPKKANGFVSVGH